MAHIVQLSHPLCRWDCYVHINQIRCRAFVRCRRVQHRGVHCSIPPQLHSFSPTLLPHDCETLHACPFVHGGNSSLCPSQSPVTRLYVCNRKTNRPKLVGSKATCGISQYTQAVGWTCTCSMPQTCSAVCMQRVRQLRLPNGESAAYARPRCNALQSAQGRLVPKTERDDSTFLSGLRALFVQNVGFWPPCVFLYEGGGVGVQEMESGRAGGRWFTFSHLMSQSSPGG